MSTNAKPLSGSRVLMVDDDADSADLFRYLLEQEGLSVTVANSVEGALGAARSASFDMLMSDVTLPDGDGCELLIALRSIQNIPGIALTGQSGEDVTERCLQAGFSEHFVKPLDLDAVLRAVRRVLG